VLTLELFGQLISTVNRNCKPAEIISDSRFSILDLGAM